MRRCRGSSCLLAKLISIAPTAVSLRYPHVYGWNIMRRCATTERPARVL
uniref:Uncharacterized protein n=1 Tax=Arundo donax TaxID=35708 RepID=A0A0A9CRN6_ARUDO